MLGSALDDVTRCWVIGLIVGTLVARRAERRGIALARDEIIERCSLFGAAVGVGVAILRNLP